jgi:isoleucyl-tRNA synthetase
VIQIREAVAKAIEELRAAGTVGSSLASEVSVWADGTYAEALEWLGDELRFMLLTSGAEFGALADAPEDARRVALEQGRIAIRVRAVEDAKCVRCWHQRPDVGASAVHPELCGRCITNVEGPGEQRRIG